VAPSGGWSVVPNTYFDHLPRCLSASAYLVVGQILRRTRWGDAVRNDNRDWLSMRQAAMAENLGLTERGVRKALDEAVEMGCLVVRKVGRDLEYACQVDRFPSLKVRKLERSGNPAPGPKAEAAERLPAALTCPQGLECPVDELVQLEDGTLSNKPLLQMKGKSPKHRNNCSGVDGKVKAEHRNNCSAIRPSLRAIAEQFTPRLGVGPPDDILLVIQRVLGDASDEQFAVAVAAKRAKVSGYGLLVRIAQDCAGTADAWKRQHAPAEAEAGDSTAAMGDRAPAPCAFCGGPRDRLGARTCKACGLKIQRGEVA